MNIRKILIAGPTLITKPYQIDGFRDTVRNWLHNVMLGHHSNDGLIYAEDTVTGHFVREWVAARNVPSFPYKAFDLPTHEGGLIALSKGHFTAEGRERVQQRNNAMMAEAGIRRALLFVETNEVAPFIIGLRQRSKEVEIIRVM